VPPFVPKALNSILDERPTDTKLFYKKLKAKNYSLQFAFFLYKIGKGGSHMKNAIKDCEVNKDIKKCLKTLGIQH